MREIYATFNLSSTDIVLIIGAISSCACSIIAALKASKANKTTEDNKDTLDTIHKQTNGNLSEQKANLAAKEAEISRLQRLIQELANAAPPGSLKEIKTRTDDHRIDDV